MTATLYWIKNPFEPWKNSCVQTLPEGASLWEVLADLGLQEFQAPTVVFYQGVPLLRQDWGGVSLKAGESLIFYTLPQGGGGDMFRTVLMAGALFAAPLAAPALGGMLGVSGALGTGLLSAGLALGGATLVNVLIPPPQPHMPSPMAVRGPAPLRASPSYSLSAQGNEARLSEPIPVIYGRMKISPDFAATPYQVFKDNQQYLCQLLMVGVGSYEIERILIEESPLASFKEIEHEVIEPRGRVTLFDPLILTAGEVGVQELDTDFCGPFILGGPQTQVHTLEVDIVCPRGLYRMTAQGALEAKGLSFEVQAREVDEKGASQGEWKTLGRETLSASNPDVLRKTYAYSVDPGRYEVRLKRGEAKESDVRVAHEIRWVGLKGSLKAQNQFGNTTLLALKMRATNNLSERSARRIKCLAVRKLPAWNPATGWGALAPTRSIAWALADVLKSTHGADLKDTRIDLPALFYLDQVWKDRGDTFDGVFDQKITLWEALTKIARVGRAMVYLQGGMVRIVRDQKKPLPVTLFTPRNIVRGSFRVQYLTPSEEMADTVTLEFLNEESWEQEEVTVSLSGHSEKKEAKTSFFGCAQKEQARREARYMALSNLYRRQLVTFETELEGLIPTYGDLIHVTHDVPAWGQGGEIVGVEGQKLTLSETLRWPKDQEAVMGIRARDGSLTGPYQVTKGPLKNQVRIDPEVDLEWDTQMTGERPHYTFGTLETWGKKARVLAVKPRAATIEITALLEDDRVHEEEIENL